MELERRIAKAKTALILEHPFFGNLAMNMPFELSEDIPTAATNGERVLFNPSFCESKSDEELLFLVAHEVCHPMFEHIFRKGDRDHKRWNYAGDAVIIQCYKTRALVSSSKVVSWTETYSNEVVVLPMVSTTCCHLCPKMVMVGMAMV